MVLKKILTRILDYSISHIWNCSRKLRCIIYKASLRNKNITILSQNCLAGVLYHDLGLQFLSPTINMFFSCSDFVKFCERLDYYLSLTPLESKHDLLWHLSDKGISASGDEDYPVMILDDLTLFMMHYRTFEDAFNKWETRKKRINKNKIFVLGTDRDGCSPEIRRRFANIPYSKVLFVNDESQEGGFCYHIKGYEGDEYVGILSDIDGIFGKRVIDQFDYIEFFNGKQLRFGG